MVIVVCSEQAKQQIEAAIAKRRSVGQLEVSWTILVKEEKAR